MSFAKPLKTAIKSGCRSYAKKYGQWPCRIEILLAPYASGSTLIAKQICSASNIPGLPHIPIILWQETIDNQ